VQVAKHHQKSGNPLHIGLPHEMRASNTVAGYCMSSAVLTPQKALTLNKTILKILG